jgi:hypothetical protein
MESFETCMELRMNLDMNSYLMDITLLNENGRCAKKVVTNSFRSIAY